MVPQNQMLKVALDLKPKTVFSHKTKGCWQIKKTVESDTEKLLFISQTMTLEKKNLSFGDRQNSEFYFIK